VSIAPRSWREPWKVFMAMADEAADICNSCLSVYRDWWYQKDLYLRCRRMA
jgi:hypothetical protein